MKLNFDRDFLLDWESIVERRLTKIQLTEHHFPRDRFCTDSALPQSWLNQLVNDAEDLEYSTLLFTLVWMYPSKCESPAYWICGIPAVLCEDTARQLERLNIAYWSPRGYHGARR